jgi:hypothetical protein
MSRLEVPLLGKPVWATGDILLRAELDLIIKGNSGTWQTETFRVDSGTEMTSMPATLARSLDLPMPKNPIPGGLDISGARREVRAGLIRARVDGMDLTEYVFPCYFIGHPDAPFDPNQPPRFPRTLLSLTGVVDKIRILFDGTSTAAAPHGLMVIEKI